MKSIWHKKHALDAAQRPGPHGPGFEKFLLLDAVGRDWSHARLERDLVEDHGSQSWEWRLFNHNLCVAQRRTAYTGEPNGY